MTGKDSSGAKSKSESRTIRVAPAQPAELFPPSPFLRSLRQALRWHLPAEAPVEEENAALLRIYKSHAALESKQTQQHCVNRGACSRAFTMSKGQTTPTACPSATSVSSRSVGT